jgi:cytochrome c551
VPAVLSASMLAMRRIAQLTLGLVALIMLTAGCGSSKKSSNAVGQGGGSPGAKIFTTAGCSDCHTLATVGAKGTVGPNLDELRPNQQRVERQVKNGGNGMPSFSGKLSAAEIRLVASFVATSAGTGTAGKVTFEPDDKKVEDCQAS